MESRFDEGERDASRRRRYEPPAVEESGDFERLVLMCGFTAEMASEGDVRCAGTNASS